MPRTIYTPHQEIQYIVRHIRKYKDYAISGNTIFPYATSGNVTPFWCGVPNFSTPHQEIWYATSVSTPHQVSWVSVCVCVCVGGGGGGGGHSVGFLCAHRWSHHWRYGLRCIMWTQVVMVMHYLTGWPDLIAKHAYTCAICHIFLCHSAVESNVHSVRYRDYIRLRILAIFYPGCENYRKVLTNLLYLSQI